MRQPELLSLLIGDRYRMRTSFMIEYNDVKSCSFADVQLRLAKEDIAPDPIIARVRQEVSALDRYAEKFAFESNSMPDSLKHRLWSCVLMGGVPLLVALACLVGRHAGIVASESAKKLTDIVIWGAAISLLLAIAASLHIAVETCVHQWLARRSLERRNAVLEKEEAAIVVSLQSAFACDQNARKVVMPHFYEHSNLTRFVSLLSSNSSVAR